MTRHRLLYLGFAFPPGIAGMFPELQPAGHAIETSMIESIRPQFDIRSVGISGLHVERLLASPGAQRPSSAHTPADAAPAAPGLPHSLNLLDKRPEVFHRYHSLWRLKRAYRSWWRAGWRPQAIMICNLSPVYDAFIRWLRPDSRRRRRHESPATPPSALHEEQADSSPADPVLILYLADSTTLGLQVPWQKSLRYRFKPLVYPEAEMLGYFDACVATSRTTERLFAPRDIPWLWLPNGCDPHRALAPEPGPSEGPIQFGYFGALAPYTGLPALMKIFTSSRRPDTLHICGFGKAKVEIAAACQRDERLRFYGPRTPDECLQLARNCDVLVNPRPFWPGNDNNFSSKVFEYALSGRAILTSTVSGVDRILGEEAFYFAAGDFEPSLDQALAEVSGTPRLELRRRGAAIQQRLLTQFSWSRQGERLAEFLQRPGFGERA